MTQFQNFSFEKASNGLKNAGGLSINFNSEYVSLPVYMCGTEPQVL
jgi:hypothetical protein